MTLTNTNIDGHKWLLQIFTWVAVPLMLQQLRLPLICALHKSRGWRQLRCSVAVSPKYANTQVFAAE